MIDEAREVLAGAKRSLWRKWSESILVRDPGAPLQEVSPRIAIAIGCISSATLGESQAPPVPDFVDTARFFERLRNGHLCFVARVGERMIHGSWLGFGSWDLEDIGVKIRLNHEEAYIYDAYTAPEFRSSHVFQAVMGTCLKYARERGVRRVYARVSNRNRPSLKAFETVEFQRPIELLSLQLLGGLGVYVARSRGNAGPLLETLILRSAQMRPGILVWRTRERLGIWVNRAGSNSQGSET
ncbi:MAG: GNAT family N-acetyltransferase [Armatimonadota bacterium]